MTNPLNMSLRFCYIPLAQQGASRPRKGIFPPLISIHRKATHLQTRCADTGNNGGRRMPTPSHLEFLKKEAKSLLKQCRSGDAAALKRIRASLPRLIAEEVLLAEI